MAYVPPHLRNIQAASSELFSKPTSSQIPANKVYTTNDIVNVLGAPSDGTVRGTTRILNVTSASQKRLAYVMLFAHQHPNLESHNEILVKSRLELLHPLVDFKESSESWTDYKDNLEWWTDFEDNSESGTDSEDNSQSGTDPEDMISDAQFPVFVNHGSPEREWVYLGWHRIAKVEYLYPGSAGLIQMLHLRFQGKVGVGRVWKRSLETLLAAVELLHRPMNILSQTFNSPRNEPYLNHPSPHGGALLLTDSLILLRPRQCVRILNWFRHYVLGIKPAHL